MLKVVQLMKMSKAEKEFFTIMGILGIALMIMFVAMIIALPYF